MPWAVFVLLLANIAVGGYLLADRPPGETRVDVRTLEVNADKVTVVPPAAKDFASADTERSAKPAAVCLEWGTFGPAELERAQTELTAAGVLRTMVRELEAAPAWWVYVPPLRSREEAERRAREIEQAGVQDVHVVADAERWRNAISLGIYKTEEGANARLARLKAAQVRNVAVGQRNDLLRLAAIVIVEPTSALAARLAELRSAHPGTELRAVDCPPAPA